MVDHRQFSEINQRRQFQTRINQLKVSCQQLSVERLALSNRLNELTGVVNLLVEERQVGKYDRDLKIDSTSYKICRVDHNAHNSHRLPSSFSSPLDLNKLNAAPSLREQNGLPLSSSDAFKIKLARCLQEVSEKAEQISEFSGLDAK